MFVEMWNPTFARRCHSKTSPTIILSTSARNICWGLLNIFFTFDGEIYFFTRQERNVILFKSDRWVFRLNDCTRYNTSNKTRGPILLNFCMNISYSILYIYKPNDARIEGSSISVSVSRWRQIAARAHQYADAALIWTDWHEFALNIHCIDTWCAIHVLIFFFL